MRTITRKCLVCGKAIKVKIINRKNNYNNGHYFGKMNTPINKTGEYKIIGTSRILGKPVKIAEFTGKEKEIEYWECNRCFGE